MVVVSRQDLPLSYQAVQSGHALADFILEHPEIAKTWHKLSNYLVYLSTSNEDELIKLIQLAESKGIVYTIFREPDLDNQITAVAFEPSELTRKMTSSLPLMRKEVLSC